MDRYESPAEVLKRDAFVLDIIREALEDGVAQTYDEFGLKGWLRSEHPAVFTMTAKAYAHEGLLATAEEAGWFVRVDLTNESIRIITPDGVGIWVQRPSHRSEGGLALRRPRSTPERRFRCANGAPTLFDADRPAHTPYPIRNLILVWEDSDDGTVRGRLFAPLTEDANLWSTHVDEDVLDIYIDLEDVTGDLFAGPANIDDATDRVDADGDLDLSPVPEGTDGDITLIGDAGPAPVNPDRADEDIAVDPDDGQADDGDVDGSSHS